jgi:hypothetical protein
MAELARRREAAIFDLGDHRPAEVEGDAQLRASLSLKPDPAHRTC